MFAKGKDFQIKREIPKLAWESYSSMLAELRTILRGANYSSENLIQRLKALDEQIILLEVSADCFQKKNMKRYLKMPSQIIVEDKRDKTIFLPLGTSLIIMALPGSMWQENFNNKKNLKVGCRTAKISRKTTHARSIVLGGVPFGSLKSAAEFFEVSISTLRRRIKERYPKVRPDLIITSLDGEKFPPKENETEYVPWWSFIT